MPTKAPDKIEAKSTNARSQEETHHSLVVDAYDHLKKENGFDADNKPREESNSNGSGKNYSTLKSNYHFGQIPLHPKIPGIIQPKLAVNTPGDVYEQEADAVAEKIVQSPAKTTIPVAVSAVNANPASDNEEKEKAVEEDKVEPEQQLVQRKVTTTGDDTEKPAQKNGNGLPPTVTSAVTETLQLPGRPLDDNVRSFMEPRFGFDFSKVRIHDDAQAQRSARDINALAYTNKTHIVFAEGQFQPYSETGRKLLAHELTHVLQQDNKSMIRRAADMRFSDGMSVEPDQKQAGEEVPYADEAVESLTEARFIVDDEKPVAKGQMHKTEFLVSVNETVCAAVDEGLEGTIYSSDNCPYIRAAFSKLSRSSPLYLEQLLGRYATGTADANSAYDLIQLVVVRVRTAVEQWKQTGDMSPVPEEIRTEIYSSMKSGTSSRMKDAASRAKKIFFKARAGGAHAEQSPQTVMESLGQGSRMDTDTRSKMEDAFEADFSNVEIHTDNQAADLSGSMNARAFTVGNHIAFGSGEHKPGTLIGDALMAHELAHVMQQQGVSNSADLHSEDLIEADADQETVRVMARLITGQEAPMPGLKKSKLKGGLRLSRCGSGSSKDTKQKTTGPPDAATENPEPPAPDPRVLLKPVAELAIADKQLSKDDWLKLRSKAAETGISNISLSGMFSFDMNFSRDQDMLAKIILGKEKIYLKLIDTYAPAIEEAAGNRLLNPMPADTLVKIAFEDNQLDEEEFMTVRDLTFIYDDTIVKAALASASVDSSTASQLINLFHLGFTETKNIIKTPGFLPLKFNKQAKTNVLTSGTDLNKVVFNAVVSDNEIWNTEFDTIHTLVAGMSRPTAKQYFMSLGIEEISADLLAKEFSDPSYKDLKKKTLLIFKFKPGVKPLALTQQTIDNLSVSWHPDPVNKFQPIKGQEAEPLKSSTETITGYSFSSGITATAEKMNYSFGGHQFTLIIDENILVHDDSIFDRIDHALATIPVKFFSLIKTLVVDPGNRDIANADANRDGKINLYISGAGKNSSQENLDNIVVHEFGHLISFEEAKQHPGFWDKWDKAIKDDGLSVSRYGLTNHDEDFAETSLLYYSGGKDVKDIRAKYPNRFKLLDVVYSR